MRTEDGYRCPTCDAPCTQRVTLADKDRILESHTYECGAVLLFGQLAGAGNAPHPCPKGAGGYARWMWHLPVYRPEPRKPEPEVVKRPVMARPPRGSIVPAPGDNREPG